MYLIRQLHWYLRTDWYLSFARWSPFRRSFLGHRQGWTWRSYLKQMSDYNHLLCYVKQRGCVFVATEILDPIGCSTFTRIVAHSFFRNSYLWIHKLATVTLLSHLFLLLLLSWYIFWNRIGFLRIEGRVILLHISDRLRSSKNFHNCYCRSLLLNS